MADYFLDDAANGTNNGLSWETCYNTWAQVNTAAILTAANRLIVGADANITDPGAALTITGPTSGAPTTIISSTVGTGTTVAYSVGTGKQVDTDSGAYAITFDGSFALYGLKVVGGAGINFGNDSNESGYAYGCTFAPGANERLYTTSAANAGIVRLLNCTIDLTADGATPMANSVIVPSNASSLDVFNMTFTGAGLTQRTGTIFGGNSALAALNVSSCDLSGFTNAAPCELLQSSHAGVAVFANCTTLSSVSLLNATPANSSFVAYFSNVGPADAPTALALVSYFGSLISSSSIYRTGGATVEGDPTSWLITTTANCAEGAPFYTPWIYGTVNSTGAKTFDLYITNDTADLTNAQVWLEVEYLATSDSAQWSLATDQRATITTTAAAQDDDTASTWVGVQNRNLYQYTENFSDSYWTLNAATVSINTATDPNGTSKADTLTATSGTGTIPRVARTSGTLVASTQYTISVYAKAGTYNYLQFYINSQAADFANFDISSGTVGTTGGSVAATITAIGSGWFRCSMTYTPADTDRRPFMIMAASASATRAQTWNPTGTETIYLWGSQFEMAASASAYEAVEYNSILATYKQKLSVPATIGETGQFRARVAVGVASIASSRYFYVDPKVTVS